MGIEFFARSLRNLVFGIQRCQIRKDAFGCGYLGFLCMHGQ